MAYRTIFAAFALMIALSFAQTAKAAYIDDGTPCAGTGHVEHDSNGRPFCHVYRVVEAAPRRQQEEIIVVRPPFEPRYYGGTNWVGATGGFSPGLNIGNGWRRVGPTGPHQLGCAHYGFPDMINHIIYCN